MTWRIFPVLLFLVLAGCSASNYGATLPASPAANQQTAGDPCQVGGQAYCVLNAQVTQATISQTICVKGWTKTIRPPVSYTSALKRRQLAEFASLHQGDPEWTMSGTELDHRLPLEVGGAPSDPHNLSPEVHRSSTLKDKDENDFRHRVCSGEPLRQAQTEFVTKWLAPWPAFKA